MRTGTRPCISNVSRFQWYWWIKYELRSNHRTSHFEKCLVNFNKGCSNLHQSHALKSDEGGLRLGLHFKDTYIYMLQLAQCSERDGHHYACTIFEHKSSTVHNEAIMKGEQCTTYMYTQNFIMVDDQPCVLIKILGLKHFQFLTVHLLWLNSSENFYMSICAITVNQCSDLCTAHAQ